MPHFLIMRHANLALLSLVGSMAYGFAINQSSMQSIEDQPPCNPKRVVVGGSMGSANTRVNTGVAFKGGGPFKLSRAKFTCRSAP
jgi:hypothetical protein